MFQYYSKTNVKLLDNNDTQLTLCPLNYPSHREPVLVKKVMGKNYKQAVNMTPMVGEKVLTRATKYFGLHAQACNTYNLTLVSKSLTKKLDKDLRRIEMMIYNI